MKRRMKSEKKAVEVMNTKITDLGMTSRQMSEFSMGMRNVRTMRRVKRAPVLNINKYLAPKEEILEAVYVVIPTQIPLGCTDYERGLEEMRYFDAIESMRVEMECLILIRNDTPHNLTGHELIKFNKHLDKVNDYRNENGEIQLLLNETYYQHKERLKGRETDSDGSDSDISSSDSNTSTYLSPKHP